MLIEQCLELNMSNTRSCARMCARNLVLLVLKVILVLLPLQVDGGTSSTHRENQCKDALRERGQYN